MAHEHTPDCGHALPDELEPLLAVVLRELIPHGICCLCGNSGAIDTRGKVFSPMGKDVGARLYCICPNGRAMKRHNVDLEK